MNKILKLFSLIVAVFCVATFFSACKEDETDISKYAFYTIETLPAGVENIGIGDENGTHEKTYDNKAYLDYGESFQIVLHLSEGYYLNDMKLSLGGQELELTESSTSSSLFITQPMTSPSNNFCIEFIGEPQIYKSNLRFKYVSPTTTNTNFFSIKYDQSIFDSQLSSTMITKNLREFFIDVIGDGVSIFGVNYNDLITFEVWSNSKTLPDCFASVEYDGVSETPKDTAGIYETINQTNGHITLTITPHVDNTIITFNNTNLIDSESVSSNYGHYVACSLNDYIFKDCIDNSSVIVEDTDNIRMLNIGMPNYSSYSTYFNSMSVKINDVILTKTSATGFAEQTEFLNKFCIDESGFVKIIVNAPRTYIISEVSDTGYTGYSVRVNNYYIDFGFVDGNAFISFADKLVQDGVAKKFNASILNENITCSNSIYCSCQSLEYQNSASYFVNEGEVYLNRQIPYIYDVKDGEESTQFDFDDKVCSIKNIGGAYTLNYDDVSIGLTCHKNNVFYATDSADSPEIYYIVENEGKFYLNFSLGTVKITSITFEFNSSIDPPITYTEMDISDTFQSNDSGIQIIKLNNMGGGFTYQIRLADGTTLSRILLEAYNTYTPMPEE